MNTSKHRSCAVLVEGLSRRFRGATALEDVSLQVPEGAIFGLVGLNGAGKTTLIRHLIGAYKPQQGSVRVLGGNPVEQPEGVLKHVGYLTEEDSLPKWMRVGDLIDFSRSIYPSWDDQYARQLCEMFSLSRGSKLRTLSKGGRARAGLLVAIAHRPQLLLLDEPSSGLDPIARKDILEAIIRTISEDGRTVLFSSHLLHEVDRVCDTIALMHEGKLVETMKAEQLQTRYAEVICQPHQVWEKGPDIEGTHGWHRVGNEWSAMIHRDDFDQESFSSQCVMMQIQDITIERWFMARAGVRTRHTAVPQVSEETSHV